MYASYRSAPAVPLNPAPAGRPIWWSDIVPHWSVVLLDLSERHHVDLHDPAVLARPWPGVRAMILGLLSVDSRLANALRR